MAVTPLVIITQTYLIWFEFLCYIKHFFGPKHLTVSAATDRALYFGGAILLKDLGCLVCFCQIGVSLILSLHGRAIFI